MLWILVPGNKQSSRQSVFFTYNKIMPSIAIVGASANRDKFGNKAVRAFVQSGYTVYPVNPKEPEIEGLKTYPKIEALPCPVDEVSFYIPPALVPAQLQAVKANGAEIVWLNPGTESDAALATAEELSLEVRVVCSILAVGQSPSLL
jgi:predicted CoA-binding protein